MGMRLNSAKTTSLILSNWWLIEDNIIEEFCKEKQEYIHLKKSKKELKYYLKHFKLYVVFNVILIKCANFLHKFPLIKTNSIMFN